MDDTKLGIDQARGVRAKALLENELLKEAFVGLENQYVLAWRNTTIEDVSGREKLFLAINIVGKVQDHLGKIISNGSIAAAELKALAETAERKKR